MVHNLLLEGLVGLLLGVSPVATPATPPSPTSPQAMRQWLSGQEAMRGGRPRQAIIAYHQALKADPSLARAHLSLAAAHLDLQEDHLAADHLRRYLDKEPAHVQVRQIIPITRIMRPASTTLPGTTSWQPQLGQRNL